MSVSCSAAVRCHQKASWRNGTGKVQLLVAECLLVEEYWGQTAGSLPTANAWFGVPLTKCCVTNCTRKHHHGFAARQNDKILEPFPIWDDPAKPEAHGKPWRARHW